jgi:hypothetical protein
MAVSIVLWGSVTSWIKDFGPTLSQPTHWGHLPRVLLMRSFSKLAIRAGARTGRFGPRRL